MWGSLGTFSAVVCLQHATENIWVPSKVGRLCATAWHLLLDHVFRCGTSPRQRDMVAIETMLTLTGCLKQICPALCAQTAWTRDSFFYCCTPICCVYVPVWAFQTFLWSFILKWWFVGACLDAHLFVCMVQGPLVSLKLSVVTVGSPPPGHEYFLVSELRSLLFVWIAVNPSFIHIVFEPNCVWNVKHCALFRCVTLTTNQWWQTQSSHNEQTSSDFSHVSLGQIYSLLVHT